MDRVTGPPSVTPTGNGPPARSSLHRVRGGVVSSVPASEAADDVEVWAGAQEPPARPESDVGQVPRGGDGTCGAWHRA